MAFARSSNNVNGQLQRSSSMPMYLPSVMDHKGPIRPVDEEYDDETDERVVGLLEIEERVEDVIALENDTALFECKVVQDLKPSCTWHKDGSTLQSNDARISVIKNAGWYRLEITHVTASDQGIYTIECRHKNEYISIKGHLYVAPRQINAGIFYHNIKYYGPGVIRHLNHVKVSKGETIVLEVQFKYESEKYIWYRNNDVVLCDYRTAMISCGASASMTIVNARPTDAGVYYVVAMTGHRLLSSFADVLVGYDNEKRQHLPIIEEYLPDDLVAVIGDEIRLAVKVHTDVDTIIKWQKNNEDITSNDDGVKIDYGNNYIGLIIHAVAKSSAGEYRLTLSNKSVQRVVSTATKVTVNHKPPELEPPKPVVKQFSKFSLLRPLESVVACCGTKVSFDCRFDLGDPIYYYVVWYVGHYKVERTNSHFNVICNGDLFLLFIKKLEPCMAGDIICELRRAYPKGQSIMLARAYARLVIVPLSMIQQAKTRPVLDGKLYYDQDDVDIGTEDVDGNTRTVRQCEPLHYLLRIVYCRLDDDGLYFVYVLRGPDTPMSASIKISGDNVNGSLTFRWNAYIDTSKYWFSIEVGQADGTLVGAGVTSSPVFILGKPPIDRMMIFNITAVKPNNNFVLDASIFIEPPPEIVPRPAEPNLKIQSAETFNAKYYATSYIVGSGAYGSVSLVTDKSDYSRYAAKYVKANRTDNALREFRILRNLSHPKLIDLIGCYNLLESYALVMEYCWGGELFDRVVGEECLKESDVVGYVTQICEGLEYLHRNAIIHLDLKPENIVCMSPNSRLVKLIDFGIARSTNEVYARVVYGTREYAAPEIIDYEPITSASDMWSLGVVTYTLLSGVLPFGGDTWLERSVNITRVSYDYEDYAFKEVSDTAKDFVDQLLIRNATNRMSAAKALEHQWLVNGPQGIKIKHLHKMRQNLKSYLADYRARWQFAGNVLIAAHRLRLKARTDVEDDNTKRLFESHTHDFSFEENDAPPKNNVNLNDACLWHNDE